MHATLMQDMKHWDFGLYLPIVLYLEFEPMSYCRKEQCHPLADKGEHSFV